MLPKQFYTVRNSERDIVIKKRCYFINQGRKTEGIDN